MSFNPSSFINNTVSSIPPSGIRKFFDVAAEMKDAISLGVGEPDFQTPWQIRKAGIEADTAKSETDEYFEYVIRISKPDEANMVEVTTQAI